LEAQESKMSYTPLKDRSDSSYDNMRTTDSTQIHDANVNPSIATEKRSQTLQANYDQPCSCNSRTNYRIVKVSPIKVTHSPYDVPTRSQSLLDQAIQATPDSANSEISNQRTTDFKDKPNKPQPSYSPYDVLTLGQTVMKDSTESSLQTNGVIHNAYDVPTKAQSLLQEAATSSSLKDKVNSSYSALTNSILSIPIESPPSPEDSDDELLIASGASNDVPEFKERLPLTYALDASNRAFSHISNGYPPSPKAEKQETIDEISVLGDKPPSVNIKLESIEGSTIGVEDSKNDMAFLSDKMPGSYDFFDMRPVTPEPVLYDFLPISCMSEKEEPAIHGQCACYTAPDIVQPESLSFRYVSKSSRMNDIEPSIHGQSPSFYPGENPKSSIEKFPVNRTSESKGKIVEHHSVVT
jgi:hypothetical protein